MTVPVFDGAKYLDDLVARGDDHGLEGKEADILQKYKKASENAERVQRKLSELNHELQNLERSLQVCVGHGQAYAQALIDWEKERFLGRHEGNDDITDPGSTAVVHPHPSLEEDEAKPKS